MDINDLPEMDEKLTQEKKNQLIERVTMVANLDALRMRDWCAIFEILSEACERERVESTEKYLKNRFDRES